MISRKCFWYFLMTGSIFLFAIAYCVGRLLFSNALHALIPPAALLILHLSEIPIARRASEGKNISRPRTILKTALFGFTWWLPLRKGIIRK